MNLTGNPSDLNQRFARARAVVPEPTPLALLTLGEHRINIAHGPGAEPQAEVELELGYRGLADISFANWPPRSVELERAIDQVEDQLMLVEPPPRGAILVASDDIVRRLLVGSDPQSMQEARVSTEDIEQAFQRMASVSLGGPTSLLGSVTNRYDAAALLLLRELMHHLGFVGLVWSALSH
jgi:hypothetical protein